MLKRITSVTVNAACPAAKEIAAGASPAIRIATGSSTQSRAVSLPRACTSAAPTTNPAVYRQGAQHVLPRAQGVGRSTASVPKTTQKAC